ncbi:nitronate monooxygenase family protein [Chromobacterium sp. IIBBL 290-4]|uniref:NAD(P)H-dependent flavin oxidoreductase n=1 Tax=Chromobacterium sp. IIBBL 290-4 TaxID=2953890 RepID=UPI0020B692EB|nr:nitronate monooxygenase [Chromobacterium sp. IIBBL 290-4]UTH76546.1 nitronate monooxygenase [Chromobacterium sp. IIBBL 290-4]
MSTALWQRWHLKLPVIQAPMAGGATTPQLISAVSGGGGLGFLAGALLSPEQIRQEAAAIRALGSRPFGINLFVQQEPMPGKAELELALQLLAPWHAELGLAPPVVPERFCQPFERQLQALIEVKPFVASFAFGILDREQLRALKQAGISVIGTATNLAEGLAWAELGADAVCAQGREAGGHRGTFIGEPQQSLRPMLSLVYELAQNLPVPVIAAGGIMNGADMAAAMRHGAQACQLGTAFLRCAESGISPLWKQALAEAKPGDTSLTRAFSGRYARGLANRYMREMEPWQERLPAYPVTNALTGPLRAAAAKAERVELMSLWAGEGVADARELPVSQLLAQLQSEWQAAYR